MYGIHNVIPLKLPSLTHREREVLRFVLAGKTNKYTAYILGISQRTVEVHRSRIFLKLGVRNGIELASAFYKTKLAAIAPHLVDS